MLKNRRAKFDAAGFILSGEIHNCRTNTTHVDKKLKYGLTASHNIQTGIIKLLLVLASERQTELSIILYTSALNSSVISQWYTKLIHTSLIRYHQVSCKFEKYSLKLMAERQKNGFLYFYLTPTNLYKKLIRT